MKVLAVLITLLITQTIGDNEQDKTTVDEKLVTVESEMTVTDNETRQGDETIAPLPTPIIRDAITESELVKNNEEHNKEIPVEVIINPDEEIPLKSREAEISTRTAVRNPDETVHPSNEDTIETSTERKANEEPSGKVGRHSEENKNEHGIDMLKNTRTNGESQNNRRNSDLQTLTEDVQEITDRSSLTDTTLVGEEPVLQPIEFLNNRRMLHDILEYKGRSGQDLYDGNVGNFNLMPTDKTRVSHNEDNSDSRTIRHQQNIARSSYPHWTYLMPQRQEHQFFPDNRNQHDLNSEWLQKQKRYNNLPKEPAHNIYPYQPQVINQHVKTLMPPNLPTPIPTAYLNQLLVTLPKPSTRTIRLVPRSIPFHHQLPFLANRILNPYRMLQSPRLLHYSF